MGNAIKQIICNASRDKESLKVSIFAFHEDGTIKTYDPKKVNTPEFVNEMYRQVKTQLPAGKNETETALIVGLPGENDNNFSYYSIKSKLCGPDGVFPFLPHDAKVLDVAWSLSNKLSGKKPAEILKLLGSRLILPDETMKKVFKPLEMPTSKQAHSPLFWKKRLQNLQGQAAEVAKRAFSFRALANSFVMGMTKLSESITKPLENGFKTALMGKNAPIFFLKGLSRNIMTSVHLSQAVPAQGAKKRDPMSHKVASIFSAAGRYAQYDLFHHELLKHEATPLFFEIKGRRVIPVSMDTVRKREELFARGVGEKPQWDMRIYYRDEMRYPHVFTAEDLKNSATGNGKRFCLNVDEIVTMVKNLKTASVTNMNLADWEKEEVKNDVSMGVR